MIDDWKRLIEEHPKVAFNYKNFDGAMNSPENGFEVLVQCEPWTNMPQNWDLDLLRRYRCVITFNPLFFAMFKDVINMWYMPGVLACNAHRYHLDEWPSFEERIDGVCCLNNYYNLGAPGDILWLRPEVMNNLPADIVRHVWCPEDRKWGGKMYQGNVGAPIHHSHSNHLRKISQYKFCLCLESTYHPLWSFGFLTERIFNCFKTKTIPIYMGCYDIEDYVPKSYFIDFRKYYTPSGRKYGVLGAALNHYREYPELWEAQVEAAYAWYQNGKNVLDIPNRKAFGYVGRLESIFKELGV